MLSPGKIIFTVIIAAIAILGYRWYMRISEKAAETRERRAEDKAEKKAQKKADKKSDPKSLELSQCKICGSYVSPGSGPCGREDCPLG